MTYNNTVLLFPQKKCKKNKTFYKTERKTHPGGM